LDSTEGKIAGQTSTCNTRANNQHLSFHSNFP
jgi:hypothetical protein